MIHTASTTQERAVLDLVRWFDVEASSLHHALIMAAERNKADAVDDEVVKFPAVAQVLRESSQRWRQIAARTLTLSEQLGDVERIDDTHPF